MLKKKREREKDKFHNKVESETKCDLKSKCMEKTRQCILVYPLGDTMSLSPVGKETADLGSVSFPQVFDGWGHGEKLRTYLLHSI